MIIQPTVPKILMRLSLDDDADGLYRVLRVDELSPPSLFHCMNKHGWYQIFYLYAIRSFNRDECIFFRGPTAELLDILHFNVNRIGILSELIQRSTRNRMRRIEHAVPIELWFDNRSYA